MAYFFSREDIEELRKEIPAQVALKYTCPEIRKKSILCPNPEHNDTHFGNCMLLPNGRVHCFACNTEFSALELLKMDGYSIYDAACILAEESGHPQDYEASGKRSKADSVTRLTQEERSLLGFANFSNLLMIENVSDSRPENGHYKRESRYSEQNGILECQTDYLILGKAPSPWRDLINENEKAYRWMIRGKCRELMVRCISGAAETSDPDIVGAFKETYRKAEQIFLKHGGTLGSTKDLYRSVASQYQALSGLS